MVLRRRERKTVLLAVDASELSVVADDGVVLGHNVLAIVHHGDEASGVLAALHEALFLVSPATRVLNVRIFVGDAVGNEEEARPRRNQNDHELGKRTMSGGIATLHRMNPQCPNQCAIKIHKYLRTVTNRQWTINKGTGGLKSLSARCNRGTRRSWRDRSARSRQKDPTTKENMYEYKLKFEKMRDRIAPPRPPMLPGRPK